MKVKYTGPHRGGVAVVDRANDCEHEVGFGATVDLPDELVESLAAQDPESWQVQADKAAKPSKDGE